MVWDILIFCLLLNVSRVCVFGSSCPSCRFRVRDTSKFFNFELEVIAFIAYRLKDLHCFFQIVLDVGGRI